MTSYSEKKIENFSITIISYPLRKSKLASSDRILGGLSTWWHKSHIIYVIISMLASLLFTAHL